MNKENVLYGIVGLLLGVIITWAVSNAAFSNHRMGMMDRGGMKAMMNGSDEGRGMMGQDRDMGMNSAMQNMMQGLNGKTGDEFDKAFLSEMIVHHQGAVDMANSALKNAQHEEIKKMANDIISAQTKEISQMKAWQQAWYNIK